MKTKPIEYTDLSFQVYSRIKEMILNGDLKPGDKIPQEKIAVSLGVSRMPLHKAFQMLEDEFLVESIPRRGIFVKKPDLVEILEAFECREGLEGIAARRAARVMTEKEIDELESLFKPFSKLDEIIESEYQKADQRFHETIINSSGNNVLKRLNSIGNVLIRTYPKGIILPYHESMSDHFKIIRAFRERSPGKAESFVREHSRKARNIIEKQINKTENISNE
ncbi:MAG: GntR family transcriptional regulator [Bacteroidales bacterium]